ncbi:MAG: glycosyltransferase family 39 protein [Planctomycetaceae bacterium]|jgi:hypothetical protein|nr:glycosyltransferase family 39 protein [Planctomycetaceae bacterium]
MSFNFQNIFSGETYRDRVLLFAAALFFHVLFWTVAPVYFLPSYQIDTMEMLVIGRNWMISTFKHPAFNAWVVEILSLIFNRADFVPYLASQISCFLSVFVVWKFAQKILSPKLALLASLTLLSYLYFNYDSTIYNNRTFMRFFWLLSVYFLYLALENGKKRYWILTGISLGLGVYCKFTIGVLIFAILIFMFFETRARRYWRTIGPYLSIGVCFFLVLPLLIWMVQNHFQQFNYMFNSIGKTQPKFIDHFLSPFLFFVGQIPFVAILLIPVYPVIGFRWRFDFTKYWSDVSGRFLLFFIFVPFLLQLIIALIFAGDMRAALGCHLWLLLPMFLLYALNIPASHEVKFPQAMKCVFANIFIFVAIMALVVQFSPVITGRASRCHFPHIELTQSVQEAWTSRCSGKLPFVRGDDYLTETVAVELRPDTNVYSNLWSNEEEFRKRGGVLLWLIGEDGKPPKKSIKGCFGNRDFGYSSETGRPDDWLKQFPDAEILPELELAPKTIVKVPPIKIGIAVVPPKL